MVSKTKNTTLLVIVLVLVVVSIIFIESRKPDRARTEDSDIAVKLDLMDRSEKAKNFERAKEISTPDAFINTDALTIEELIGDKIVLVDFWTYSCINCQRTLPFLNSWHEKYADEGLVILGIHTPEFEFEKKLENVQRAVDQFEIKYPVILDNDYSTWTSYRNRYWPRKYLIDIDGFIVYDHIGEGAYEATEAKIVELLNERKHVLGEQMDVVMDTTKPQGVESPDFNQVRTRETYLGSLRLKFLANAPAQQCITSSCDYVLPNDLSVLRNNEYVLGGGWRIEPERVVLEGSRGSIAIAFSASKVNLVAEGLEGTVKGEIYLDGQRVGSSSAGDAVSEGSVLFDTADLYNLIDLRGEYGEHILEIRFEDSGVGAFAFTFG